MKKISVLGVGSVLMTDEGIGVHVVQHLMEHYDFTPQIELLDGGTMGMELLHYLKDTTHLLVIDAMHGDDMPGTIYVLKESGAAQYFSGDISAHEAGMKSILQIRAALDGPALECVVVGVEPELIEVGLDLTDVVKTSLPIATRVVLETLKEWGVDVVLRHESQPSSAPLHPLKLHETAKH